MLLDRRSYAKDEIAPGLVVFASGDALRISDGFRARMTSGGPLAAGASADAIAKGNRYFVVLARRGDAVVLAPAYTTYRPARLRVAGKTGHLGWVDHETHIDPRQFWIAGAAAVVEAAEAARDLSSARRRNRVTPRELLNR